MPYHGERENRTVQLQAGRGGKDVERGDRAADRKEQRGSGRQPYAGQNPRGREQSVSGRVRPRHLRHGGESAQRVPRHGYEPQDAARRVQAAQRGLRQIGGQDEEPAQLLEILRGLQAPVRVHQDTVQSGGHHPERTRPRLHHGLRAVPPGGERALHQHRMVVHDAFPQHHLHRHQQWLAATRSVLCLSHHEGGDETGLPDERGNHADDKRHVQEEELRTDTRPVHLLLFHRCCTRQNVTVNQNVTINQNENR